VITDQTMPGLTGVQLRQELDKLEIDVPLILTSGYSENISHETALELGFRDYVAKPASPRQLGGAIRQVLDVGRRPSP